MRQLLKISTLFTAIFFLISCGSDTVAPEPESPEIEPVESLSHDTFHPVTDSDVLATLANVREATAQYHDVTVAEESGYHQESPFVPGMGYHYVKPGLAMDAKVIPTQPEALVYVDNPVDDSKRQLVAVEYLIPDPEEKMSQSDLDDKFPGVDGEKWHYDSQVGTGSWTLHAWVWYPNPEGVFQGHNSRVGDGS